MSSERGISSVTSPFSRSIARLYSSLSVSTVTSMFPGKGLLKDTRAVSPGAYFSLSVLMTTLSMRDEPPPSSEPKGAQA